MPNPQLDSLLELLEAAQTYEQIGNLQTAYLSWPTSDGKSSFEFIVLVEALAPLQEAIKLTADAQGDATALPLRYNAVDRALTRLILVQERLKGLPTSFKKERDSLYQLTETWIRILADHI